MSTADDIPPEFRDVMFRDYVRYVTGSAVIAAQYVERVLSGVCLALGAKGLKLTMEDWLSGDSSRTRNMLGDIRRQLGGTFITDEAFCDRVSQFAFRRNRIIHGFFIDCFKGQGRPSESDSTSRRYVAECEWVASEAAQLVEVGFGIYSLLMGLVTPDAASASAYARVKAGLGEFDSEGLAAIRPQLHFRFRGSPGATGGSSGGAENTFGGAMPDQRCPRPGEGAGNL